jgi:NTE family protein
MARKATTVLVLLACALQVCAQQEERATIALVLTGGGARGLAQVGVIRQLEEMGIQFDIVLGSSIGAIVGGLYASGYTGRELDSIMRSVDWSRVTSLADDTKRETMFYAQKAEDDRSLLKLRFRDFKFLPPEALGGSAAFARVLQEMLWQSPFNSVTDFDQLRCRFRAVATDLSNGTWKAIGTGNLATAMQASATFPLRYAPMRIDSSILVDGGLVANIPIDAARQMNPSVLVVVNTVSDYMPRSELENAFDVADQALTAAMKQRDSVNLAMADEVITPVLDGVTTFDFSKVDSTIIAGEVAARAAAPRIRAALHRARIRMLSKNPPPSDPDVADSILMSSIILKVDARSDLPLRSAPVVDSLLTDMLGRSWSDPFARHFRWKLQRAMHLADWSFAYTRAMAYDSSGKELTIVVDPGRVQAIRIDPQRPVRYADVIKEFTFEPGEELLLKDLRVTSERLRASELFTDVDLSVVPAADSGVDILVGASDRGNQLLRIGARVDNERLAQGGVDFIHQNVGNTGLRVGIRLVASPRLGEAQLTFEMPRIVGSLWTAGLRGYASFRNVWAYRDVPDADRTDASRERYTEFSEDRFGARLSAGRQLERNGVILAEVRYEQQRYREVDSTPEPEFQPLTTIRGLVRWDDRDRIDFASGGRVIDLSLESSLFNFSNGISFTKAYAKLATIVPIGPFAITPSAFIGAADKTLPSQELFSMGGQDLFFGMREDEERGRQIALGNIEGRYRLPIDILFPTYVSLRYDLGAVWAEPEQIKFAAFKHGLGLTLGFDTPVGPARFSVGRRFYFIDDPPSTASGPFLGYFAVGVRL